MSALPEIELQYGEVSLGDCILDVLFNPRWAFVLQVRAQETNPDKVSLLLSESDDQNSTWVHRYRQKAVRVRRDA